jgi:S-(hydroxymethyl)glutathione dehydrogenase/alcohol dehydrogenase
MRAQAAILRELNAPLTVETIEVGTPDVGQVLVEVRASGICGAQIREITGGKGADKYLPHLLGHEGGGVVREVGPGVRKVKPGDHVVLHWRKGTGIDAACPTYFLPQEKTTGINPPRSKVGGGWVTTFNTHALISENRLTVVPDDLDFGVAALLGCGVTTGLGIINNEAKLKMGQSIAVAGVGGVGLNVVQGAAMVSAGLIMAIECCEEKWKMVRDMGADYVIPSISSPLMPSLLSVDVFVDCTGVPGVIQQGLRCVKPGGKLILVGQPQQGLDLVFQDMQRHYQGKTIMDSQGGLTNPDVDIPRYVKLYQAGKLKLDELITHRFPLSEINQAVELMKTGLSGRIIVEMPNADAER